MEHYLKIQQVLSLIFYVLTDFILVFDQNRKRLNSKLFLFSGHEIEHNTCRT